MTDKKFTSNPMKFTPGDTEVYRIILGSASGGAEKVFELWCTSGSFAINTFGAPNSDSLILSANERIRVGNRDSKILCYVQDQSGSGTIVISRIV